jgi:mRNA-degrading endonuclease toxin of MazEF toxin-antitoxin module
MKIVRGDIFFANLDPVIGVEVRTLDKSRLTHKAGHLSDEVMAKVDRVLMLHLDL